MLNFSIDYIFVDLRGLAFQQTFGLPTGTNCASILTDLGLLLCYVNVLLKTERKSILQSFFRITDENMLLNNSHMSEFFHLFFNWNF